MNSNQWMEILETVGIPAAFAIAAGWMVYKLFNALISENDFERFLICI